MVPSPRLLGLDEDPIGLLYFDARVAIREKLVFIEEFVRMCDDPAMLRWIRNRLHEPHRRATRKLVDMDELDTSQQKPKKALAQTGECQIN